MQAPQEQAQEQAQDQAQTQPQDQPQQFDVDPGAMIERIDGWVDGAVRMLPNIAVGIIVFALFYGLSVLVKRWVSSSAEKRDRANLGDMLGSFAKAVVIVLGFLLAATIIVPSVNPGDLIAGLGIGSVAIGFAFKDILQNWLAGLLILIRQPFQVGDQIEVEDYEGTVEQIETRATLVRTYDGQRVVIPNSEIYTNPVLVKTAFEQRRTQYDIGIGYGDDIRTACEVLQDAVEGVSGVAKDPGVQVYPWDLAASWVTIRVRWWTESPRSDIVQLRAHVIEAMKNALDDARIDMPYETRVQLMHDQTEAADGDRAQQREGWPAPNGEGTTPRWQAEREQDAETATAGRT